MAEKFGKQVKIYYTNNKQTTSVTGIDASSYILFNGGSNHIYTHGKDFAADPSHTHKFLELSDVKDTFSKPADTTNTWVPVAVNGKIYHREIPAAYNQDPSTLSVNSANTANIANTANSLSATCAANDYIGIKGGGSNDNGYLEIYTGDNGNEPIYLRQYSYDSSVAIHSATLLDSNGNTSFPGTISSNGHTVLTNRIDPIISVACTSSGILTFTSNNNNKYEFNFNHTHDLSQLSGKIKVECLPDAALKDTTYSYSVTQSATNNNANPYLTLIPSNSGTVSNIQLAGGSNVTITRDSASKIIISSLWRPLGTGSNDAAAGNHTHDSLVVDYADSTSFNAPYHNFQVLYAGGGNGIEGRPADVDAFGLLRFRVAAGWSGQILFADGGDLYIRSAEDSKLNKSLPWKRIIDSGNIGSQSVNYANSAGNADTANRALALKDYNGSNNIYCGYAGDGLNSDNIGWMVGIKANPTGNNIYYKNVSKSELQKWLGFNANDFVKAFSTSNDNIDSDWGQSFKTFDPIPSGTPPEQNPNISLLSIGDSFNRRKQLAFIYSNDNIYYRRHVNGAFTNWKRIAFASEIPTKSSWNYDDRYLKLTGGTVNGEVAANSFLINTTTGIRFKNDILGSGGDTAFIKILGTGEDQQLTIGVTNDAGDIDNAGDIVNITTPATTGLKHNGNTVWDSANDGMSSGLDADLLDGVHLNGIFTALANSGNNVSLTIGGITKTLTVNYASNATNATNANSSDIIKYLGNHNETASGTTGNAANAGMAKTSGLFATGTYNDNATPTAYGNIINIAGLGGSQLLLGWSGTNSVTDKVYYRSHRDNGGGWGEWKQLAYTTDLTWENISGRPSSLPANGGNADYATNATNADTAIKLKDYNGSNNIYCGYAGDGLNSDNIGYMVGIKATGNDIYYKDVSKSELQKWLGLDSYVKKSGDTMSGFLNATTIELFAPTPYIDFHYNSSSSDYTSRIVEYTSGVLTITGGLEIYNNLSAQGGKFYTDSNGAYWTSDIRKKHDFSNITKDIADKFFEKNYFKHFKWNDTNHDSWGVAAQEFEEWAPEAINTDEDGFKSANYDVAEAKAIAAMTYKIKEQQITINELKEKLKNFEKMLNKLI